jgi:hypothetical protein
VRGAVEFDFPTNLVMAPESVLLLVSFDPVSDPASLAAFRSRYGLDPAVPLFGPYRGKLANSSDSLELLRPEPPRTNTTPYVLVERIDYHDAAPWPDGADGTGASLLRRVALAYGNEPTNWVAALPSPGGVGFGGQPPLILAQPPSLGVVGGQDATLTVEVTGTEPLRYQWRFNDASLAAGTNATLIITNTQPRHEGEYRVTVMNRAGVAVSDIALLTVRTPPRILSQPQGLSVSPGSDVTFAVTAEGVGALRYQWRFESNDLPGATGPSLALTNVQLANHGAYAVRVSDDHGDVLSQVAFLAVRVPPVITAQPQPQTVAERDPVTFSVSVSDYVTLPLGFRWRRATTTLTNIIQTQTTCFFTIPGARLADAGNYTVIITNGAGQQTISTPAILTVLPDFDGDGLPDVWEAAFGFDTNTVNNSSLDPDGDGLSNRDEYLAGTNPTNALDYLKIDRFLWPPSLEFAAVSNKSYTVECRDGLSGKSWRKLLDVRAQTTNRTVSVVDPSPPAQECYYRLKTPMTP